MINSDSANASHLAGEFRVVIGKLIRRLREQVRPGDLTWSQMAVIGRLDREGPATVTTLARAEKVRPQSLGATIAVLEAAGQVIGAPDPADGRQTIWSVTEACRDTLRANRAAREDWLFHAIENNFAPAEFDQLAAAVELLKRLADAQP